MMALAPNANAHLLILSSALIKSAEMQPCVQSSRARLTKSSQTIREDTCDVIKKSMKMKGCWSEKYGMLISLED